MCFVLADNGPVFLATLDSKECAELDRLGRSQSYRAGDVIMRQGDPPDFLLIIETGVVQIVSNDPYGSQVVLGLYGAGDIVGEIAVIDKKVRSATAKALTNVKVSVISATSMNAFLDKHPWVMKSLLITLSNRLRKSTLQLNTIVGQTVDERLVKLLLDYADRFCPASTQKLVIPLSQQDLADMVGASREAVVKALRDLRKKGLIETARKQVVLLNVERLRTVDRSEITFGIST